MHTEPDIKPKPKKKQAVISLISFLLIGGALAVIVVLDLDPIKAYISHSGVWGLIVSIGVYAILGMTPIPSEPLTLLIGAAFGPWVATFVSWIGNTLSGIVEFEVGHRVGKVTSFLEQKEKLPFGLGKLKVDSIAFLIGARMIPGYGSKFVSLICGFYHVRIFRYIWTTALTVFFGSLIFSFGGFGLGKLFE